MTSSRPAPSVSPHLYNPYGGPASGARPDPRAGRSCIGLVTGSSALGFLALALSGTATAHADEFDWIDTGAFDARFFDATAAGTSLFDGPGGTDAIADLFAPSGSTPSFNPFPTTPPALTSFPTEPLDLGSYFDAAPAPTPVLADPVPVPSPTPPTLPAPTPPALPAADLPAADLLTADLSTADLSTGAGVLAVVPDLPLPAFPEPDPVPDLPVAPPVPVLPEPGPVPDAGVPNLVTQLSDLAGGVDPLSVPSAGTLVAALPTPDGIVSDVPIVGYPTAGSSADPDTQPTLLADSTQPPADDPFQAVDTLRENLLPPGDTPQVKEPVPGAFGVTTDPALPTFPAPDSATLGDAPAGSSPFALGESFTDLADPACWMDDDCRPEFSLTDKDLADALARVPVTAPENAYLFKAPRPGPDGTLVTPTNGQAATRLLTRAVPQAIGAALENGVLNPEKLGIEVFDDNDAANAAIGVGISSASNVAINEAWKKLDPLLTTVGAANPGTPWSNLSNGKLSSGLNSATLAALPATIAAGDWLADTTNDLLGCTPSAADTDNGKYWCKTAVDTAAFTGAVAAPVLADDLAEGRPLNGWSLTPAAGAVVEKVVRDVGFGPEPPVDDAVTDAIRGGVRGIGTAASGVGEYVGGLTTLDPTDPAVNDVDRLASLPVDLLNGSSAIVTGLGQQLALGSDSRGTPDLSDPLGAALPPTQDAQLTASNDKLVSTVGALLDPRSGELAGNVQDANDQLARYGGNVGTNLGRVEDALAGAGEYLNDALNDNVLYPIGAATTSLTTCGALTCPEDPPQQTGESLGTYAVPDRTTDPEVELTLPRSADEGGVPLLPPGEWQVVQTFIDGSKEIRWPSGETGGLDPDGTVHRVQADGYGIEYRPDGTIVRWTGENSAIVSVPPRL